MFKKSVTLFLVALLVNTALAHEDEGKQDDADLAIHRQEDSGDRQIPEQVTIEHWAYKEIAELGEKYAVDKKLPAGRPCTKSELTHYLLAILDKIVEKYDKEGPRAIPRDDVEKIAALHGTLESELDKIDGYRTVRKTIEEILVLIEPEAGDLSGVNVGNHHASGMQVYTLGWGSDITEKLNFSATGHKFIAMSVEDGFSRQVGLEADFNLTYTINKDLSIILAYDRFFTDRFFQDASGSDKDITYAYAMLVFNFDKTKRKAIKTI